MITFIDEARIIKGNNDLWLIKPVTMRLSRIFTVKSESPFFIDVFALNHSSSSFQTDFRIFVQNTAAMLQAFQGFVLTTRQALLKGQLRRTRESRLL